MRVGAPLLRSSLPVLSATFLLAGCFAANPDWEPPDPSSGADDTTGVSGGSASASGGSGATGTSDGSGLVCEDITDYLVSSEPDIMFVIDKSGSMIDGDWADQDGATRWESLYGAMEVVLAAVDDDAALGLMLFPRDDAVNDYHPAGCYIDDEPAVPVDEENTPETIIEALPIPGLEDELIKGGTPAGEAMRIARQNLLSRQDGQMQFIVLVTDGVANCDVDCGSETNCLFEQYDPHLLSEVESAFAQGIATLVVGVAVKDQPTPIANDGVPDGINPADALNEIAQAGGIADLKDGEFLDAGDPLSLFQHLTFLTDFLTPCHLSPSAELNDVDPYQGFIEVSLNGEPLPLIEPDNCFETPAPGWTFIDDTKGSAVLCGSACAEYQMNDDAELEVLYCVEE